MSLHLDRSFFLCLVLIGLGALGVRIGAAYWWQSGLETEQSLRFGDSDGYLVLADNLANGRPYQYGWKHASVFRSPGYPILLAVLVKATGNAKPVMAARVLGALMGSLTVLGVGWLGRKLLSPRAGLLAALMIAFYPGAIATSVMILTESPFGLAMVLALIGLAGLIQERETINWGDALLFGIASAVGTLIRPSWLLFVPAVLAVVVVTRYRPRQLATWGIVALSFAVVMSPWVIRNHQVVGRLVPTTLQTGSSLYDGLHANADGGSDMSFVPKERLNYLESMRESLDDSPPPPDPELSRIDEDGNPTEAYWPMVMLEVQALEERLPEWNFEVEFDAYLRNKALAWAKEHPADVAELAFWKLLRMWSPTPIDQNFASPLASLAQQLSFDGLMLLVLLGLYCHARDRWLLFVCLAPAVYFTMIHMIFVSSIRYREPAVLVMAVIAAGAADAVIRRLGRMRDSNSQTLPSDHS